MELTEYDHKARWGTSIGYVHQVRSGGRKKWQGLAWIRERTGFAVSEFKKS